ncbi:MAG: PqiC family protein [Thermodesulfobacteriota bacterium]
MMLFRAALLALACLVAACAAPLPVRYYQLPATASRQPAPAGRPGQPLIGLGPLLLPDYLDRPGIVTRVTATRLSIDQSHRWAEPLAESLSRALQENLTRLLDTESVLLFPWPTSRPVALRMPVAILGCEAGPDGAVRLEARWSVAAGDGTTLLAERRSSLRVVPETPDREAQVAAMGEALARLAGEMAAALKPWLKD